VFISIVRKALCAVALFGLAAAGTVAEAQSAPAVVINGQPMTFDQPPVEQAGRLFVPLRGVFEKLGASVVYQNGTINATLGNLTIGLQVGSNQAMVGGHATSLDAPPFLLGGRVLVPLRFISQALGASVNYDSSTQTVYVNQGGNVAAAPPRREAPPPPPPAAPVAVGLIRIEPADGTSVERRRPEISATFEQSVDANTVRISIDGRDVSSDAYISDRSFVYDPNYDLPLGPHSVAIRGRIAQGPRFSEHWTFVSQPQRGANYINDLRPGEGMAVGGAFDVTGLTEPGSRVKVVAASTANVTQFVQVAEGSAATEVGTAPDGRFVAHVNLSDQLAGSIDVRIVSTAPDGSTSVRTLRLRP